MTTRWVGIDEAGYGPNFGPMVMTAVVAQSLDDRAPDVWSDLSEKVCRAGGDPEKLWVDDSKAIYRAGIGRDRLEAACLAALATVAGAIPETFAGLLAALGAGTLEDVELSLWLDTLDPPIPRFNQSPGAFDGASWRLVAVRSVVVGPARFNEGLGRHGSKARVHFEAFAGLIDAIWTQAADGVITHVRGDKHGGRHFYYEPLLGVFPDAWIDRGVEGPDLSRYTVRDAIRRLELSLLPLAPDANDGLVALASIVGKQAGSRTHGWTRSTPAPGPHGSPGLRPRPGIPSLMRFASALAIEPHCVERGLDPSLWWRLK